MSESEKSLLPRNLSQLERNLAGALSRISEIEIPISTLWDPDLCPLDALPVLAWALRVDSWQSDWPESRKRAVIKESVDINRTRGTRGAVERSISAIRGDEVKLIEWFEDEKNLPRGTFRIDVKSTNEPIDITELQQLGPSVLRAKNTRSHLTGITVTSQIKTPEKHIALSRQGHQIRSGPWFIRSMVSRAVGSIACVSRLNIQIRSGPLPFNVE
ncbi:phage tail protein I [Vibrio parahaemolyticus]|uniref:phage tail protein I n=1 Tax=Vibrio parahaemolyticus TaxID=670 RepID=UPI00235F27BE|nr:phage tail protein I [Vibrio parahaemolyticus]